MAEDDRHLVERSNSIAERFTGQPTSLEDIADEFEIYGLKKRVAALENLEAKLRSEIDSSPQNLRRRVQLMELRRRMGGVHEALCKAKR